jgi:hypothetical protein
MPPVCKGCQHKFIISYFVLPRGNFTMQTAVLAVTEGGVWRIAKWQEWGALGDGGRAWPPPPNKYITQNVFLLEARSDIAPGNQPDLLFLWQPTDTHTQNCAQFTATRDAAEHFYAMVAEVLRLNVGTGVSGRYPKTGHDTCMPANCTALQSVCP